MARERGVTHLCVDTMRIGLTKPDQHVEMLRRFRRPRADQIGGLEGPPSPALVVPRLRRGTPRYLRRAHTMNGMSEELVG